MPSRLVSLPRRPRLTATSLPAGHLATPMIEFANYIIGLRTSPRNPPMERQLQIESWLGQIHPGVSFKLAPASAEASFRRYSRISFDAAIGRAETLIVMDAPLAQEDCRPWLHAQHLFHEAGAITAGKILGAQLDAVWDNIGTPTQLAELDAALKRRHSQQIFRV